MSRSWSLHRIIVLCDNVQELSLKLQTPQYTHHPIFHTISEKHVDLGGPKKIQVNGWRDLDKVFPFTRSHLDNPNNASLRPQYQALRKGLQPVDGEPRPSSGPDGICSVCTVSATFAMVLDLKIIRTHRSLICLRGARSFTMPEGAPYLRCDKQTQALTVLYIHRLSSCPQEYPQESFYSARLWALALTPRRHIWDLG
jgi:hypothetical protein